MPDEQPPNPAASPPVRWDRILVPVAILAVIAFVAVGPSGFTGLDPEATGRAFLRGELPYRDVPLEYPPGGALVLALVALVQGPMPYLLVFRVLMGAGWVGLALLVRRAGDAAVRRGFMTATLAYAWILFALYDVLVALLAFLAWRALSRGATTRSQAWVATGVVFKWVTAPLLLLSLPHPPRARRLVVATAWAALAIAIAVVWPHAFASGGGDPLTFQGSRPLHAESTLGSFVVLRRVLSGNPAGLVHDHRSIAVAGLGSWSTVAPAILMATALLWIWWRGDRRSPSTWAAMLLAIPALGPVASPQFFVWPLGFAGWMSERARSLYVASGIVSALYFVATIDLPVSHPLPVAIVAARSVVALAATWRLAADGRVAPRTPRPAAYAGATG
ncbi:MAG TPA: hypothetical protein VGB83_05755 [Actinomycetota bacterium]